MESSASRRPVGILTFHNGPNFGGFLQAWHLREAIRKAGHPATVVNYQGLAHYSAHQFRLRKPSASQIKGEVLNLLKSRPFRKPVAELSELPFTVQPDQVPWSQFQTVVVGSDMVWDFQNRYFGSDPAFYASHPSQAETRFVAYAPSCGPSPATAELPDHVRNGLKRFDQMAVRDENTADMAEKATGTRPPIVVDPTWLQNDPVVSYGKRPKRPYALVYGQGMKLGNRSRILGDYCRKRGLELVAVTFPCSSADRRIHSIGPFEWIDLFRHAECVVTSTFHGLLYAIKFRKPLVFMERIASRLKSQIAVDRCNLQGRTCPEGDDFSEAFLNEHLSNNEGITIPDSWVQASRGYLEQALQ
ncbi:MAG: polysaccharide pyruvyl transferase family protein [Verrucomicrobiota bacterium JB025]|nr:polysaccharide pyruvyl transferase family protein [Verrucomicrobiota bacterium JB025]